MNTIKFQQFELDSRLLHILDEIGFEYCTPVQAECLPLILEGHDIAGQAQTGTGKTAAFLLSTFHFLLTRRHENYKNILSNTMITINKEEKLNIGTGNIYGTISYNGKHDIMIELIMILQS